MNFLNNTFVTLESPVSSSDRVIFVKKFIGNLGENFPLSAVLQESDSAGTIIKREIIRITGKNDTMLNVERAVELCPQSDTAERPSQNPLNFSENAVIIHTLTAGDLGKILGKITDVRKIPDIRGINRKPKEYVAQTFYGPEFVQGSVVGITGVHWVDLQTYNPWTNHSYITQTAISASGNPSIWIRKARDADNWEDWQKIFPFSADGINFQGLAEESNYSNLNDTLPFVKNGVNKKVTIENLRRWIISALPRNITDMPRAENSVGAGDYVSTSTAVPRGGFFTISTGTKNGSYTQYTILEYSTNNSTWSNFASISGDSKILSGFAGEGFVRIKTMNTLRGTELAKIQIF